MSDGAAGTVLWWGRFDPDYSRNRILRQTLLRLGWKIKDFRPKISPLGHLEATLKGVKKPDLLWLPAFRQRDMAAAAKWAARRGVPILFDPMISSYDKQVFERRKFPEQSAPARSLLARERKIFAAADLVLADTEGHAAFFRETLNRPADKVRVVALGAEEGLFTPAPMAEKSPDAPLEVLFFGSFIGLQGPEIIIEAAKRCRAEVRWTMLGDGPLKEACEAAAAGHPAIRFEGYLPYDQLPARIHAADILLGVFGVSAKAERVIPNKVYQALACGRPVIPRRSTAYPGGETKGLLQIPEGDPDTLAETVAGLAGNRHDLPARGHAAEKYYAENFSKDTIHAQLEEALALVLRR
ncbi:MAG: hypothetical protein CMN56_09540 [Sneathiella sp.]|mgnify:CR=1 FL=1|uniref:glycosyltransferase n=1 Tax=Sneathiella sp. TaxID=1964365 RepID=UPI000C4918BE|nr:glycosyltransferase [Sneathiella sp.]MAZ03369.1 hypothetical protein [Sneathiella sp.]